jgi:hypothetical protein
MGNSQPKEVFNIIEAQDGKSKWVRVGAAFTNRDGSINVLLNTFPSEGKLQIRERRKSSKDGGD